MISPAAPPARGASAASPRAALVIGLCAALLFSALAGVRLGAQGPQYDELHQAPGAFSHLGASPDLFSLATLGRYPLLNMGYSAAIKTHLYGLYLRLRGEFRLVEWRALGILIVAVAILAFAVLAASALPVGPLALLLALLVADATLLVLGRHDWGPVCLGFLLRALLLGLWLRGETSGPPRDGRYAAGMGAVAGLAVFEKLSSVVLLAPLFLFVAFGGARTRRAVRAGAAVVGLAIGGLPLVALNAATGLRTGRPVSLQGATAPEDGSLGAVLGLAEGYLGLGAGSEAASLVLGLAPSPLLARWEAILLALCLGLAVAIGLTRVATAEGRRALVAVAGYGAVLVALIALPRGTWIHHWLLGTPLQLLAVALALAAGGLQVPGRAVRVLTAALWLGCGAWLAVRASVLVRVERAIAEGRASPAFDPELIALGELGARRAKEALFVATDWGVATQIYCFASARADVVEPFWGEPSVARIRDLHRESGKPLLYLVRLEPPAGVGGSRTAHLERAVASAGDWIEVPLDPEARSWQRVWIRKYAWAPGRAASAATGSGRESRAPTP